MANRPGSPNASGNLTAYSNSRSADTKYQLISDASIQYELFTFPNYRNAKIVSGQIIRAPDINRVCQMINALLTHFHSFNQVLRTGTTSFEGVATPGTWGDTAMDRSTYVQIAYTGQAQRTGYSTAQIADRTTGNKIFATEHNEMASRTGTIRLHTHAWTDKTMDLVGAASPGSGVKTV